MTPDISLLADALVSVLLIGSAVFAIAIARKLYKWIGRTLGAGSSGITYADSRGHW